MDISKLQEKVRNWTGEKFPGAPSYLALIKIMSELGELSDNYLLRIEQRAGTQHGDAQYGVEDAVADILISLCIFAEREGIDLDKMTTMVWDEIISHREYYMMTAYTGNLVINCAGGCGKTTDEVSPLEFWQGEVRRNDDPTCFVPIWTCRECLSKKYKNWLKDHDNP